MANFTKGKWHTNELGMAILTDDKTIAVVGGPVSTEERIANARLIVKAPEMHKILSDLVGVLAVHIYTQDTAIEIAKLLNEIDGNTESISDE